MNFATVPPWRSMIARSSSTYRFITPNSASGSSSSPSVVEPVTSQNRTVTTFRAAPGRLNFERRLAIERGLTGRVIGHRRGRLERGILVEDCALELLQLTSRLQAKLGGKLGAGAPVDIERVGLPPAPVKGEHLLRPQVLAQRVLGDELFELDDELAVVSERKVGIDALLDCLQAKLLEPADRSLRERLVREIGERRPAPQSQRLAQLLRGDRRLGGRRLPDEALEALQVELVAIKREDIPGGTREQLSAALSQRLA